MSKALVGGWLGLGPVLTGDLRGKSQDPRLSYSIFSPQGSISRTIHGLHTQLRQDVQKPLHFMLTPNA